MDGLTFDSTGREETNLMEKEFGEDMVQEVLKYWNNDKAPRPDGCSLSLFQMFGRLLNRLYECLFQKAS